MPLLTTVPSSGNDDGWWTPGGWIPANLPIVVDNTAGPSYFASVKSLQFKNNSANYGTLGTGVSCASGAPCTVPGARWGGVSWTDASGNLWMFGGQGAGLLNDIWEFDITSGPCAYDLTTGTGIFTNCKWIWRGGSSAPNQPTTTTFPGARWGAASYTDAAGNLWMFGGQGYDSSGNIGLLNDLWKYNIASQTWTLILPSGVISNQNGSYGTQGTGATGNAPGGRPLAARFIRICVPIRRRRLCGLRRSLRKLERRLEIPAVPVIAHDVAPAPHTVSRQPHPEAMGFFFAEVAALVMTGDRFALDPVLRAPAVGHFVSNLPELREKLVTHAFFQDFDRAAFE
jgi:hypothetical protein